MRTLLNSLLSLTVLIVTTTASAVEIARLSQKVAGFVDHSTNSSVHLISEAGPSYVLKGLEIKEGINFKKIDAGCNIKTQNTMVMGNPEGGMTLAYPYLVGVGKVCYIDESIQTIRLISDYKKSLPRNSFSVVYAGSDDTSVYFLINSRPYPEGTSGFISAIVIDKATQKVSIKSFLTDVPGFSAAMVYDQQNVWITAWVGTNDIYKISTEKLLTLLQKGGLYKFSELAVKTLSGFEGLSSYALKNDVNFLFYNEGYESYAVSAKDSKVSNRVPSCEPIAGFKSQWHILCDGHRVELVD